MRVINTLVSMKRCEYMDVLVGRVPGYGMSAVGKHSGAY